MDQRLVEAERELVAFHTCAAGVRAQNYAAFSAAGSDWRDAEAGIVARLPSEWREMAERDKVALTLSFLDGWNRFVLGVGYSRTGTLGVVNELLAAALTGSELCSLAALAPLTARAARLVARELGADAAPEHGEVLRLLERQAGQGATALLVDIRNQAAELRDNALLAYAVIMAERKAAERTAKRDRIGDLLDGRIP